MKYLYNSTKQELIDQMLTICNEDGVPQADKALMEKLLDLVGPFIYKCARDDYGDH